MSRFDEITIKTILLHFFLGHDVDPSWRVKRDRCGNGANAIIF